jgi:hypothetical protein
MHIETRQVGSTLRLGADTRVVIHRREGPRVVLGASAPAGTALIFDGTPIRPVSDTAHVSHFLFCLQAIRRFVLGRYQIQVWLPGEWLPDAADCVDWLHFGIVALPAPAPAPLPASSVSSHPSPWQSPVAPVHPLSQSPGGGRLPLVGGTRMQAIEVCRPGSRPCSH